jgi:hypothetical protein
LSHRYAKVYPGYTGYKMAGLERSGLKRSRDEGWALRGPATEGPEYRSLGVLKVAAEGPEEKVHIHSYVKPPVPFQF